MFSTPEPRSEALSSPVSDVSSASTDYNSTPKSRPSPSDSERLTMINVFRTHDKNGRDYIALVLSPDAMLVTAEGDPMPGVAHYVPQAREIAHRLLLFAQEIENGRPISFHAEDSSRRFRGQARPDSEQF